jgi:hypothetical protein
MHATDLTTPILDTDQDWELLEATESQGVTYIKFRRETNTCSVYEGEDYPIGFDTNRIIWAIGSTDNLDYHRSSRGTKSLHLLGAKMPELFTDDDSVQFWDMTIDHEMPPEDTTYWCSFHRGPKLDRKHHIIAVNCFSLNFS